LAAHREFFKFNPPAFRRAIGLADQAIARDPNYPLPHFVRAVAYLNLPPSGVARPAEAMPQAKRSALRTVELAPNLPYSHAALSMASTYSFDFAVAERSARRAIELDANQPDGYEALRVYTMAMGPADEAIAAARRAMELVPSEPAPANLYGSALFFAGRTDEALAQARKALDIDPTFAPAYVLMANLYRSAGRLLESAQAALRNRELAGVTPERIAAERAALEKGGPRGLDEFRLARALERITGGEYVPAATVAGLYLNVGDRAACLDWLEKAALEHDTQLAVLRTFPLWRTLRGDARYEALCRKLGLG
jgi:tetratricopeptide (TPR) repeat protein